MHWDIAICNNKISLTRGVGTSENQSSSCTRAYQTITR